MNKRSLLAGFCLSGLLIGCPAEHVVGPDENPPSPVYCGDGESRGSETCDGEDLEGQSCEGLGLAAGQLACKPDCRGYDVSGCGAPDTCGNGAVDGVERCDGSDLDGESCEGLGYGPGLLTCLNNCADFDTSACAPPPGCGDGQKNGSEICDGQDFGSLTCARLGLGEGELRCYPKCDGVDSSGCQPPVLDAGLDAGRDSGSDAARDAGRDADQDATAPDTWAQDSATADSGRDAGQEVGSDAAPGCPAAKDCSGRACGPDPICGESCGSCDGSCSSAGVCTPASYSCDQPEALHCGDIIDHAASTYSNWISDYSGCGFDNNFTGGEVVFAFTAPRSEQVLFELSGSGASDLDLLILRPACDTSSCVGSSTGTSSDERVSLALNAGDSLHVVVDGYLSAVGRFTLTVQCGASASDAGPGDTASTDGAVAADALPPEAAAVDSSTVDSAPAEAAAIDSSTATDAGPESGPFCTDYCSTPSSLSCSPNQRSVFICRDSNGDGCLEKVYLRSCSGTQTCVDGACVSTCSGPSPCNEEVVISEIHFDPAAVSDMGGEYIELYNRSDHSVDLAGCTLSDDNSSFTLPTFVIGAHAYGLVGRSSLTSENGGISPDVVVTGNPLRLNNTGLEKLTLFCGFVMDSVDLRDDPPGATGVSLQLDPGLLDPRTNDLSAAWCDSTVAYGAGDLGSPGAANTPCMKSVIFFDDLSMQAWTDPRWTRGGAGKRADASCNWEWGSPRNQGYYVAPSCSREGGPQYCLTTDLDLWAWYNMSYSSNWVQLGPIDLSAVSPASQVELLFYLQLHLPAGDADDHAQVVISSDGVSFVPLAIRNLPYDDPVTDPVQWTSQNTIVPQASANLSRWIGESQVYIRWQQQTDGAVTESGVLVDNVWIVER